MGPQSEEEILEDWSILNNATLAHVFLDAAQRINGEQPKEQKALSTQVGLYCDFGILIHMPLVLHYAFNSMVNRVEQNPDNKQDQYLKPILDALEASNITNNSTDKEAAEAVRGLIIPEAEIERHSVVVLY
tara:strand:- start:363 stop:755 length:393 start_codon:yes stop_codon:yes gene_type:complete